MAQLHVRTSLYGLFPCVQAELVQAPDLLVTETEILAHAGIPRHAQKAFAAFPAKSAVAAALLTHPALAATAHSPFAAKPVLAVAPLMLSLRWALPLGQRFLTPAENRRPHQNHQTQCANRNFPSHT
jgi:hypothetical protein